MADTCILAEVNTKATCADCGRAGCSHMLREGWIEGYPKDWSYFCFRCAQDRHRDLNAGLPPKPLGYKTVQEDIEPTGTVSQHPYGWEGQ